MGLSKEEKAQLEALSKKAKEPDGPSGNISFTLPLDSDTAWERARALGLIPGGKDEEETEEEPEETPNRPGFFGK